MAGGWDPVRPRCGVGRARRDSRTARRGDAGRQELVLAGTVSRRRAFSAVLGAVGAGAGLLWVALLGGLVVAGLPLGPSAYLSLATVSAALVFAGVGALASQLAPTRRLALELSGAALLVALLLRVIADTSTSLQWVRWMTPLGWVEELRPFVHPQPAVLILPVLGGAALLAVAAQISLRRDVGTGVLAARDRSAPRLGAVGLSHRAGPARRSVAACSRWVVGVGFFAVVVGTLSTTFTTANVAPRLREQLQHVGGATITTPSGALGLYFLFFVLVISLFAASQVAAARHEEAGGHLETLLRASRRSHRLADWPACPRGGCERRVGPGRRGTGVGWRRRPRRRRLAARHARRGCQLSARRVAVPRPSERSPSPPRLGRPPVSPTAS